LRLILKLYEEDDYFFPVCPSNGARVE
jgi:hypothetical protein